jgi:hypothetical protein
MNRTSIIGLLPSYRRETELFVEAVEAAEEGDGLAVGDASADVSPAS